MNLQVLKKISETRISRKKLVYVIALVAVITLTVIVLIYLGLSFPGVITGTGGSGTGG